MDSQAVWLLTLVLVLAVGSGGSVVVLRFRRRVRQRMAGIDGRLDDLQHRTEALRLPLDLLEIEKLVARAECAGRLSTGTADELRSYLEELRSEVVDGT